MRCLFIYNPVSGKGKVRKKLPLIRKRLKIRYDCVDVYETRSAEDLRYKIKAASEEYDAIIFSGGDGTFNNVIGAAHGSRVPFGYLPTGTVNDVARSLKIPRNIKGALRVIVKGNIKQLDCIKIGDRYAMYLAAAGAFTSATYHTPQEQKQTFGALAYFFEAIRHNLKFDVFPITAESGGERIETNAVLVLVMNGRSVAGFPINKKGSMTDGIIETAIIKQVKKPNWIQRIGALFSVVTLFVFGCKIKKKDILYLKGEKVRIGTDRRVTWDFDGEEGFDGSAEMEVCPGAVKLFVPGKKKV